MKSVQGVIRENVVAAIRALPDWPATVPVEKVAIVPDVFTRGHRKMVGVCLTDDTWTSIDKGLADNLDQPAEMDISVAVYATSEASPTGALDVGDGNIDGLVGLLLGSNRPGYGPGLRSADVGVPFETGGVYCRAVRTYLMAEQRRAEGAGGGLAKIIVFKTTVLPL